MTSPAPHTATLRHAATPALPDGIATPAFILDVAALKRNLATAARIKAETGVKILLATKAWAMPAAFPLMRDTLDGTTASGLYEARLGREEFGKEVHVYAPAYTQEEVSALTKVADHIYFNTPSQIARFLPSVYAAGKKAGIRVNPGFSMATLAAIFTTRARRALASARPLTSSMPCLGTTSTPSIHTRCAKRQIRARSD